MSSHGVDVTSPFRTCDHSVDKRKPANAGGFSGGNGEIRTHVTLRSTAFRVRLVTTTSIRFQVDCVGISVGVARRCAP